MDATRLRTLIDGALAAQHALESAENNLEAARKAVEDAQARHRQEVGNLQASLNTVGAVAYGDKFVRVGPAGNNRGGQWVHVLPLVCITPLPVPMPETPTERKAITPEPQPQPKPAAAPLSGGRTPDPKKK